ncbi:hypothetical protein [Candidatus Phytoplasma sacchari]|uniref:Uncharacterized protein n=1 Tax=Candidatus Phytoplasma sacchari TaxID=2609813 RepID=A0ABY7M0Q2_9MOLU|nr:hypothetical protein O7R10_01705 [Candidatus Phytoplasma sacchari]
MINFIIIKYQFLNSFKADISSKIKAGFNPIYLIEIFITYSEIKEVNNELILSLIFKTYSLQMLICFHLTLFLN